MKKSQQTSKVTAVWQTRLWPLIRPKSNKKAHPPHYHLTSFFWSGITLLYINRCTHSTNPTAKLPVSNESLGHVGMKLQADLIWVSQGSLLHSTPTPYSSTSQLGYWEVELDTRSHKSLMGPSRLSRNSNVLQRMLTQSDGNRNTVNFQRFTCF